VKREFPAFGMDEAGTRVVFASDANLVGRNADGNGEIYAVSVASRAVVQITETGAGVTNSRPILSGDGKKVVFLSNADFNGFGLNSDRSEELWLYHFDEDRLYRRPFAPITDLASTPLARRGRTHWMDWYSMDADGSHVAMCTDADLTTQNPGNYYEIFLATFDWDPEPEVAFTSIASSNGTQVLRWQANRTNLVFLLESRTDVAAGVWSPVAPTSQWWLRTAHGLTRSQRSTRSSSESRQESDSSAPTRRHLFDAFSPHLQFRSSPGHDGTLPGHASIRT